MLGDIEAIICSLVWFRKYAGGVSMTWPTKDP